MIARALRWGSTAQVQVIREGGRQKSSGCVCVTPLFRFRISKRADDRVQVGALLHVVALRARSSSQY